MQADSGGHVSILTVNKSKEPFPAQIDTVCQILRIDLDVNWTNLLRSRGEHLPYQYNASDPRPQWALKWLLKHLQPEDIEPNRSVEVSDDRKCRLLCTSPCLSFRSWLLLRGLVVRIHPTKTATLLKDYKFTSIVCNTLQWLYENHDQGRSQPLSEDDESIGASNEDGNTASSSTRTARKRRRDGTEIAPSKGTYGAAIQTVADVFMALCATVGQLVELTSDSTDIKSLSVEHIKSAMRSSLEKASQILGNTLFLTNYLMQEPNRMSGPRKLATGEASEYLETTAYRFCVSNMINLWSFRSLARRNAIDNDKIIHTTPIGASSRANDIDQHAFRTHCMLPALQLIHNCRERSSPEKNIEAVTTSLEDLLITYTVLPFRDSIVGSKEPVQLQSTDPATALKDELVSALHSLRYPKPKAEISLGKGVYEAQRQALKTTNHLKITYLSLLFEIALGIRPALKSNNSRANDHWLEELFMQLIACAEIVVTPTSTNKVHKDRARLVGWMLRKCVDHKLQLSLSGVQAILDQFSGLSSSDCFNTVEWSVVSLCLQTDPNAFVVPNSSGEANVPNSTRRPNKHLSAILSHITDGGSESSRDYEYLLTGIVLPLCSAFADARDLDGFIHYWIEQTSIHEKRQSDKLTSAIDTPCLWQDERLLQRVAQLVESKLTPGQVDHLASSAAKGLTFSTPSTSNTPSPSLASLLVLDCLFAGVDHEATLKTLAETAQSVFIVLSAHLSDYLDHSLKHKWRMWRIKTTIADRWVTLRNSPLFKRSAQSAICTASETLGRMRLKASQDKEADWDEELYAFRCLLHLVVIVDSGTTLQFPPRTRLVSAVREVLELLEPFCHRISHAHFQSIQLPAYVPRWDEFEKGVKCKNTLYLGCVADILITPTALR